MDLNIEYMVKTEGIETIQWCPQGQPASDDSPVSLLIPNINPGSLPLWDHGIWKSSKVQATWTVSWFYFPQSDRHAGIYVGSIQSPGSIWLSTHRL